MPTRRVTPDEALELMTREGYVYVDVRSVGEFDSGHPEGAFNVPLAEPGPGGLAPNPDFLSVIQRNFPSDAKLVLGCASGGRSATAASVLARAGYPHLCDQVAGFLGGRDERGARIPGWGAKGLPSSASSPEERTYRALKEKP